MALARYSSRVFAAWRAVAVLLDAVSWPAHSLGGSTPTVTLADTIPDQLREVVAVVPSIQDDVIEWVQMGAASREERFGLDIVFRTTVPGVKGYAAAGGDLISRLEAVSEKIQAQFYNTTTGVFAPPSFSGVEQLGGISLVQPAAWPGEEGWEGEVLHRLLLVARI